MNDLRPIRVLVLHRGGPPLLTPDPWGPRPSGSAPAPPDRASMDVDRAPATAAPRVVELARGIASSAGWRDRPSATLIVREDPEPVIAAIGRFNAADERWLDGASQQLAFTLPRVRWLDAAAVEAACTRLASALADRFGSDAVRRFRYAAVPRGGLIVLGTLAYLLDLMPDRLLPGEASGDDGDEPIVIVDDIAISGLRLSSYVERRPEPRLIVATLHAHPELRAAFLLRHPRVEAFVAAYELHDQAATTYGDGHGAWRERWRSRAAPGTVWIGQTERVVYPWGEPEAGVWNDVLEREEPGWSVMPPDRVLKRRSNGPIPVQRMLATSGPLTPAADVVAGAFEGGVVVGHLGNGHAFALNGVAADTWQALVATGDVAAAAVRLSDTYGAPIDRIRASTATFANDLVVAGVLTGTTA